MIESGYPGISHAHRIYQYILGYHTHRISGDISRYMRTVRAPYMRLHPTASAAAYSPSSSAASIASALAAACAAAYAATLALTSVLTSSRASPARHGRHF